MFIMSEGYDGGLSIIAYIVLDDIRFTDFFFMQYVRHICRVELSKLSNSVVRPGQSFPKKTEHEIFCQCRQPFHYSGICPRLRKTSD
jgi:hypothetical protein